MTPETPRQSSGTVSITFGSRTAARRIRDNPQYRGFLAESDDGRESTVRLKESTPERALSEITGEAAETKEQEAEKAGQAPLTRDEREAIDFGREGVNVPKVRSIKGIAANEGVDDFMSFADLSLTVDENRELLKEATREERGQRGLGRDRDSAASVDKRIAQANKQRKQGELDRAKDFALVETDADAQEFVEDRGEFDIGFTRSGEKLLGQGEDFDRLKRRHERRSSRAQTIDERRQAPVTRNPIAWANNPGKLDFPGIDTVQPKRLHQQRSEAAREADEAEWAPLADSKEQWARNPDQYDLLGVDTPSTDAPLIESTTPDRPAFDAMADGATTESRSALFEAELAGRDVPASREEVFGGGFTESQSLSATHTPTGLASGEEADRAFLSAERDRAQSGGGVFDGFVDDSDTQGQLTGFGMDTDATQHRKSRTAEESATTFGVDDRSDASRGTGGSDDGGEQRGFETFGGGVRENETLF